MWFEFRQGRDVELSRQATWWPRGPHTDPRQNAKLVFALCRTAFLQMGTKARTGHSPFLETHLQGRRGDPCQLEAGVYFSPFFRKSKILHKEMMAEFDTPEILRTSFARLFLRAKKLSEAQLSILYFDLS